MAYRKTPFTVDEWYHCYSRGIDKRITFNNHPDYMRFLELLYLCNDIAPYNREYLLGTPSRLIFKKERVETLVSIGCFCLMPNHFHILLREKSEGGISRFMQKVGTAYAKYFNEKEERIGGLFVKPFRSKHIDSDAYLNRIIPYIHLNPAELYESGWKDGEVRDMHRLEKRLMEYHYSSLQDFEGAERPEHAILDLAAVGAVYDISPRITDTLQDATEYYRELKW